MDLLNTEMVVGNGQLLLVSLHLLDISMLLCVHPFLIFHLVLSLSLSLSQPLMLKIFLHFLLFQVFVNARLHVSGGALGGGRMVEDSSSVAGTK